MRSLRLFVVTVITVLIWAGNVRGQLLLDILKGAAQTLLENPQIALLLAAPPEELDEYMHASVVKEMLPYTTDDPGLSALGRSLAEYATRRGYKFHILEVDYANAFSCPGCEIFITRPLYEELISRSGGKDEVAWILGHEIAHSECYHSVKKFKKEIIVNLGVSAIGSAILGNLSSNPSDEEIKQAVVTLLASRFSSYLLKMKFSRDDEIVADRMGVRFVKVSGYDMYGAVRAIKAIGGSSRLVAWLQTHPSYDRRIEEIQAEINSSNP